ncbi:MAG: alpha/beta fold hydrolase [Phycisphaerales bacterium]
MSIPLHLIAASLTSAALATASFCVAQAASDPSQPPATQPVTPAEPAKPAEAAKPAEPALLTPLAHVEVRGSGPIHVVLIPGLVSDWTTFESFMERNAAKYTMYAVTLPGFGSSAPPPAPAAPSDKNYQHGAWLANAERAVAKLVEDKKLDKPVLMGQTLGAHIALRVASAAPDKYRCVIAVNGWPAYPIGGAEQPVTRQQREEFVNGMFAQSCEGIPEPEWQSQQKEWIQMGVGDPARAAPLVAKAAAVPKATSSRYMLEYLAADLTEQMPATKLPVLAIAAIGDVPYAEDLKALYDMWQREWASVPQLTLVHFEDTLEFVTESAPVELDRAVEQFLAQKQVEGKKGTPKPPRPAEQAPVAEPAPVVPPAPAPTTDTPGVTPPKPGTTDPAPADPGAEPKPGKPNAPKSDPAPGNTPK